MSFFSAPAIPGKKMDLTVVTQGDLSSLYSSEIWQVGDKYAQADDTSLRVNWMGGDALYAGSSEEITLDQDGIRRLLQDTARYSSVLYRVTNVQAVTRLETYDAGGVMGADARSLPLNITWQRESGRSKSFSTILAELQNHGIAPPSLHEYKPDLQKIKDPRLTNITVIQQLVQERAERMRQKERKLFSFMTSAFVLEHTKITITVQVLDNNYNWWYGGRDAVCMCAKWGSDGFVPVLDHVLSGKSGSPMYRLGETKESFTMLGDISMMLSRKTCDGGPSCPDILVDVSGKNTIETAEMTSYCCRFGKGKICAAKAQCLRLHGVQLVQDNTLLPTDDALILCVTPLSGLEASAAKLSSLHTNLQNRIRFNSKLWQLHQGNLGSTLQLQPIAELPAHVGFWEWSNTIREWPFEAFRVVGSSEPTSDSEFLYHGLRESFFDKLKKTGHFDLLTIGKRNNGFYGAGIYLTESSCDAFSYGFAGTLNPFQPAEDAWYVLVVTLDQRKEPVPKKYRAHVYPKYPDLGEVQLSPNRTVSHPYSDDTYNSKYGDWYALRNTPSEDSAWYGDSTLSRAREQKFGCLRMGKEVAVFDPFAIHLHYVIKFRRE